MKSRSRRLLGATLGLCALTMLVACTNSRAESPQASATQQPTPVRAATSVPQPMATATLPSAASASSAILASNCTDPYANGAPFTPTPGRTVHLQPLGAPPQLARYEQPPLVVDEPIGWIIGGVLGHQIQHYSVVVKRLDTNQGYAYEGERVYYAASLYKLWGMVEAFHQQAAGMLNFDEPYIVTHYYASLSLNEGEISACSEVTMDQALEAAISYSDNIAGNIVLERDGVANVNNMLRGLGLTASSVQPGGDVFTSASDMALLLEMIGRRQLVSPEASDGMLMLLESSEINDRLPAQLPKGTVVAHKTGNWINATHDAGIVYSPKAAYVIVVLSDEDGDSAATLTARLSKAVYDYINR